jgi:DNA replication protein DnaC
MLSELSPLKRYWITKGSNIPIRFHGWSKDKILESTGKFSQDVEDWLQMALAGDVIKKPGALGTCGLGMLFDGDPGMGKTTYAAISAIEFIRRLPDSDEDASKLLGVKSGDYGMKLRAVYYTTYPEYLSLKRSAFDAEPEEKRELMRIIDGFHGRAKEDHLNVRVLIIDDLGKEHKTTWNESQFDELLRSRYDKGLPTIITTNVLKENWAVAYSEAMGSFANEAFVPIRLKNKDLRMG